MHIQSDLHSSILFGRCSVGQTTQRIYVFDDDAAEHAHIYTYIKWWHSKLRRFVSRNLFPVIFWLSKSIYWAFAWMPLTRTEHLMFPLTIFHVFVCSLLAIRDTPSSSLLDNRRTMVFLLDGRMSPNNTVSTFMMNRSLRVSMYIVYSLSLVICAIYGLMSG